MSDDSDSPFERCSECGQLTVSLAHHTCSTDDDGAKPAADEREQLANDDDRDPSRPVLLPSGAGSKAYHEIDAYRDPDDVDPGSVEVRCWQDSNLESASIHTQREANERGYYPCGSCRRIEHAATNQST